MLCSLPIEIWIRMSDMWPLQEDKFIRILRQLSKTFYEGLSVVISERKTTIHMWTHFGVKRYVLKLRAVRNVSNQPVRFSVVEKSDPVAYYNCDEFDVFCMRYLKNQKRIAFGMQGANRAFPTIWNKNGAIMEYMECVSIVSNREILA